MPDASILIVGGGPAGLSTAGALKRAGIDSLILERDGAVGERWGRRYERLHLHTIRRFSGLAHFPIPAAYPKYVPKDSFAQYLRDYAKHFALDVETNCSVSRVAAEGEANGSRDRFVVETNRGTRRCQVVVIASGMFGEVAPPPFQDLDTYRGRVVHASAYSSGRDFAGKRVLVVGLGNTGAEIAADLVEQGASFVAVSVRSVPPIVPRDFLGTPVQLFGLALSSAPVHLADKIGAVIARVAIGDLTQYGLRKSEWFPFSAKRVPVIDVGFVANLRSGRIVIRPTIARFSETGVVYDDGREEEFDAVIFAMGYETGLDRLLGIPGLLETDGYPRFASGQPTSQPGLYFMGYFKSHRGHFYEIDRASRRLARTIAAR
jgi:cation diffusion facilitator CzcD-associated flavoprotein CzcO